MDNQPNSHNIIKGVSSQTVVTLSLGILDIISFSIMSRLLSKQDFGYYAAIIALSTIFSSLSSNGIGAAIVQRKELDRSYVYSAFTLSLVIGGIASGLLCAFSGLLSKSVADSSMQFPLILFSSTLIMSCIISVNMAILQRQLKFLRMGLINLISLVLTTVVAIILAIKGFGYYAILAKAILGSIITLLLSYYAADIKYRLYFNINKFKEIFSFSGWLMASSLFRNFANQIDRLLMSSLFSVATLGTYSRPKEFISNISDKFNSIFDTTLFPMLSTIQDDKIKMRTSYLYALNFLNILGMLLSITFFFNSELIIRIFFGEDWLYIGPLFKVLSLSSVLYINGRIGDIFLRSLALTKSQFYFRVMQLIITVILIILLYGYGITAVAIAAMLGYGIVVLLKVIYISHHIKIPLRQSLYAIFKGWYFVIYIIPIYLLSLYIYPSGLLGNLLVLLSFFLCLVMIFVVFPSSVGDNYKLIFYPKIKNFILKFVK